MEWNGRIEPATFVSFHPFLECIASTSIFAFVSGFVLLATVSITILYNIILVLFVSSHNFCTALRRKTLTTTRIYHDVEYGGGWLSVYATVVAAAAAVVCVDSRTYCGSSPEIVRTFVWQSVSLFSLLCNILSFYFASSSLVIRRHNLYEYCAPSKVQLNQPNNSLLDYTHLRWRIRFILCSRSRHQHTTFSEFIVLLHGRGQENYLLLLFFLFITILSAVVVSTSTRERETTHEKKEAKRAANCETSLKRLVNGQVRLSTKKTSLE